MRGSACSSALTWKLTVDCVRWSADAARVKLPCSTIARNVRSWSISMAPRVARDDRGRQRSGRAAVVGQLLGVAHVALDVDAQTGEARASGLMEHTAQLGGSSTLGNISSFGVDADGELYIVSYSRGTILRMTGPVSPPATPSGFRIIR